MSAPARHLGVRNLVTYLSLLAGLLSVVFAAGGQVHAMAALWVVSAVADVFDGAFARLFSGDDEDRRFGIELDSLVDALAFGAFPVIGLYLVAGRTSVEPVLFFTGAMLYLVAVVTRLGHFNLGALEGRTGLCGLPTTEAALVLATLLLWPPALAWGWLWMGLLGVAMVAPLPLPRPGPAGQAIYLLWPAGVLAAHLAAHITTGGAGWP